MLFDQRDGHILGAVLLLCAPGQTTRRRSCALTAPGGQRRRCSYPLVAPAAPGTAGRARARPTLAHKDPGCWLAAASGGGSAELGAPEVRGAPGSGLRAPLRAARRRPPRVVIEPWRESIVRAGEGARGLKALCAGCVGVWECACVGVWESGCVCACVQTVLGSSEQKAAPSDPQRDSHSDPFLLEADLKHRRAMQESVRQG